MRVEGSGLSVLPRSSKVDRVLSAQLGGVSVREPKKPNAAFSSGTVRSIDFVFLGPMSRQRYTALRVDTPLPGAEGNKTLQARKVELAKRGPDPSFTSRTTRHLQRAPQWEASWNGSGVPLKDLGLGPGQYGKNRTAPADGKGYAEQWIEPQGSLRGSFSLNSTAGISDVDMYTSAGSLWADMYRRAMENR